MGGWQIYLCVKIFKTLIYLGFKKKKIENSLAQNTENREPS